jgi:hypothetical protein
MTYRDIRDANGRLLARFDPRRDLLAIKNRGRLTTVDLRPLRDEPEPKPEPAKPEPRPAR